MELAHHRAGAGEPLVLVHGTGSQWQAFRPVLDLLAARHDVIAPDLPGFGAFPPTRPSRTLLRRPAAAGASAARAKRRLDATRPRVRRRAPAPAAGRRP